MSDQTPQPIKGPSQPHRHDNTPPPSKSRGTQGTEGTTAPECGLERSPELSGNGEHGEQGPRRPGYATYHDWTDYGAPGLYLHGQRQRKDGTPESYDTWIASPIEVEAITASTAGDSFGLQLTFTDPDGNRKRVAVPMRMLSGGGDEMRAELMDQGVRINPDAFRPFSRWLMQANPARRVTAATRTGWHGPDLFVLPRETIGQGDVIFQSEHLAADLFQRSGTLDGWREQVAALAVGNPVMMFGMSVGFLGPLFERIASPLGAGFHFYHDSSSGKTTVLTAGASVWGGPEFIRTWRSTANGAEGTAAAVNDTLLANDEISEADPREIDAAAYMIGNGTGKTRASRSGTARRPHRWRVALLSTGERTLAAHMAEGGRRQKAGQSVRLLDIPAGRAHGVFDELHGHDGGRSLADAIKRTAGLHYGHAGPEFVRHLIEDKRDIGGHLEDALSSPGFAGRNGLEGRAAHAFAAAGIAGELATEYGLTGWPEGEAISAAAELFGDWAASKGEGVTETRQICQQVAAFFERFEDARFSDLLDPHAEVKTARAGWWRDRGDSREYLLTASGLTDAVEGFDLRRITAALDTAGWLSAKEPGKRSTNVRTPAGLRRVYAVTIPDGWEGNE
ncbi:DUF927 domain-containing protein [Guyparkeria sp.]|uniref:DUF927 domain-containing protein n=1 Tax=Guyparkeria sp. TaxID=2035736 RepID=UPI003970C3A6